METRNIDTIVKEIHEVEMKLNDLKQELENSSNKSECSNKSHVIENKPTTLEDALKIIKLAKDVNELPCNACKDCVNTCIGYVLKRVLNGGSPSTCFDCDEPLEYVISADTGQRIYCSTCAESMGLSACEECGSKVVVIYGCDSAKIRLCPVCEYEQDIVS